MGSSTQGRIIGGIIAIVAIVLVASTFWKGNANNNTNNVQPTPIVSPTDTATNNASSTTVTGSPQTGTKTYTLSEVAKHSSATSCWTTVRGVVYDVTTWIGRHPGGQQAILSLCGKDGTAAFTGQHGGQTKPENTLASFKIGMLAGATNTTNTQNTNSTLDNEDDD